MVEPSPAVERAWDAAQKLKADRSDTELKVTDVLLGLLSEDEGKPAILIDKLGLGLEQLRNQISGMLPVAPPAPTIRELVKHASDHSSILAGDPTPTSEYVFLAAVSWNTHFAGQLAEHGLYVEKIVKELKNLQPAHFQAEETHQIFEVHDSIEESSAARVVDANLNRSTEALRVLDDYCRFVLDDAYLTQSFKDLRHRLAEAAKGLNQTELLASRNTVGDIGRKIESSGEYSRNTPADVATASFKRLQESFRSLEEFGKILSPQFARTIESLRYATYTLERAVCVGATARQRLEKAHLYVLLTGAQCSAALDWTIAEAAAGGVDIVQMREKKLLDREMIERAKKMRKWTRTAGVMLVINDRPDLARLVEADALHLGQDDMGVSHARKIVGKDCLIGVSTHNLEQLRQAILDGADYVGIGPVFPSSTKQFDAFAGLEFVREACAETQLPAFALGGIQLDNVAQVVSAGCRRVAVSSVIATADDPRMVAQTLKSILTSSHLPES